MTVGDWLVIVAVLCVLSIAIPLWVLMFYAVLTYRYNYQRHTEAEAARTSREASKNQDKKLAHQKEIGARIVIFLSEFKLSSEKDLDRLSWNHFETKKGMYVVSVYWGSTSICEIEIDFLRVGGEIYFKDWIEGQSAHFSAGEDGLRQVLDRLKNNLSRIEPAKYYKSK